MAVPSGYDIGLDSTDPADANAVRGFMLVDHRQQDITPSSARRSDGDTRFQLIPSESFWSQQDFAGGFGRLTPHDPTMYGDGPIDGADGRRILPQWDWTASAFGGAGDTALAVCADQYDGVYAALSDGAGGYLFHFDGTTLTWTLQTALASKSVTALAFFRGKVWIGYGGVSDVQAWDGASLTTPVAGWKAQVLAPYASMIFYVFFQAATNTWRLNRYDPENTAAVSDLAIVPVNNGFSDYVRSLVALGPDLFLVCMDALYKFTSSNGNSGTLIGPVDTWRPAGVHGAIVSGYGACAWQGALYYPAGLALRRHQPGGNSRQIWPVAPNVPYTLANLDNGVGQQLSQLVPADDRLYALGTYAFQAGTTQVHALGLFCWTGAGMHLLDEQAIAAGSASLPYRAAGALTATGLLVGAHTAPLGTPSAGARSGYWRVAHTAALPRKRRTTSYFRTSVLDFGMLDLDKVIARIGLVCTVPSSASYGFAVSLWVEESSGGYRSFVEYPFATKTGDYGATGVPALVYYTRAAGPVNIVGKRFYIRVTITSLAEPASPPELFGITCVPNPVYPVRYGFRATIPIGTHVRLHSGGMAYADQAAVDAAVAYCRTLRASSYPFTLDWIDGASYTVRANTIVVARDKLRPTESAWVVTLDLQQIGT